jgi:outer membrane receptor protein involved in Fe transport
MKILSVCPTIHPELFQEMEKSFYKTSSDGNVLYPRITGTVTEAINYAFNKFPDFDYYQSIYAGYMSVTSRLFNYLDTKAGLRFEHTDLSASTNGEGFNLPSYNKWLPSVSFSHTFNNNDNFRVGYTKRLQRPGYRELNPFLNAADPTNISQGNPNLQPEIGNRFEAGYTHFFKKDISLNLMGFFNRSNQDIQNYVTYYAIYTINKIPYKNVSVNTWANIGREDMYGFNLNANMPFSKKFTLRVNGAVFKKYIIDNFDNNKVYNSYNYRINGNLTCYLSKTITLEGFINYRSARTEVQGTYPSFSFYSLALKKTLLKGKGSLGFTCTNPFNLYINMPTTLTGYNFTYYSDRKVPFRSFGISFNYQFGKISFNKDTKKGGKGGADDDDNGDMSTPPQPKPADSKGGDGK